MVLFALPITAVTLLVLAAHAAFARPPNGPAPNGPV